MKRTLKRSLDDDGSRKDIIRGYAAAAVGTIPKTTRFRGARYLSGLTTYARGRPSFEVLLPFSNGSLSMTPFRDFGVEKRQIASSLLSLHRARLCLTFYRSVRECRSSQEREDCTIDDPSAMDTDSDSQLAARASRGSTLNTKKLFPPFMVSRAFTLVSAKLQVNVAFIGRCQ